MNPLWTPQGPRPAVRTAAAMAVLRGKGMGLEIALGGRDFEDALAELQSKLCEQPGFYTGASAIAALGASGMDSDQLHRLNVLLNEHGIGLEVLCGAAQLEPLALEHGLRFAHVDDDGGQELARRRALRPKREVQLSEAARSLVADFAGARADIATRRKSGESSVRRVVFAEERSAVPDPALLQAPPASVGTLYHVGTLRGGQALHHEGNIVVVGDVNPGAELVATGDILVFGALRGVAHAGAQGDGEAKVHALGFAPTQLRIATSIAADTAGDAPATGAQTAAIRDGRIAIFPRETMP